METEACNFMEQYIKLSDHQQVGLANNLYQTSLYSFYNQIFQHIEQLSFPYLFHTDQIYTDLWKMVHLEKKLTHLLCDSGWTETSHV